MGAIAPERRAENDPILTALARVERLYAYFAEVRCGRERLTQDPAHLPPSGRKQVAAPVGAADTPRPHVDFVPTSPDVVELMLGLAGVTSADVVFDLGCGDGRIVIAAARRGARAVAIERDRGRIEQARAAAAAAGVDQQITFHEQNLYDADLQEATVVTLYLLRSMNPQLRETLRAQLAPGARIVSHAFDMGDWKPDKTAEISGRKVFLWILRKTPARSQRGARKKKRDRARPSRAARSSSPVCRHGGEVARPRRAPLAPAAPRALRSPAPRIFTAGVTGSLLPARSHVLDPRVTELRNVR